MELYLLHYFTPVIIITLVCLGFRSITEKGKIGYPIRQYFETRLIGTESLIHEQWNKLSPDERKTYEQVFIPDKVGSNVGHYEFQRPQYAKIPFLAHPFVLCVVCMPSLWGTTIYLVLQLLFPAGLFMAVVLYPIVILSCPFLTGYFWIKYKSLEK